MPVSNLHGVDWFKFEDLVKAWESARSGDGSALSKLAASVDLEGVAIGDVLADLDGDAAGAAFRLLARDCHADEGLEDCDVEAVRDALGRLLKSPSNGCDPADVDRFLPPAYDGSQRGKGKLGGLSWLSRIVHRGTPSAQSGVKFYIPNPEVPELFGELSPTEIKYDGSPDAKTVRRFYDFVEALMIVGEGGYQVAEDGE